MEGSGLQGKLVDNAGKEYDASSLASKKFIGIYFSAHWCPPCRGFTPVLAEFYNSCSKDDIEIVFVSSDQDEAKWKEYFATMPWKSIPFGDARKGTLGQKHSVSGIPCLVIIKPDGTVISANARNDVQSKGPAAIAAWESK